MGKDIKNNKLLEFEKLRMKLYYKNNRETIIAKVKAYNQDHKEQKRIYAKSWADANKERISTNNRKYYLLHKEEILARRRAKRLEQLNINN